MKEFVNVKDEHKYLFGIGYHETKVNLLHASIQLNLFSHLDEWKDAEKLANDLGYDGKNTRHVLDALAAIDLIDKKNNQYRNKEIASLYLSRSSETYAGELIVNFNRMSQVSEQGIMKAVQDGSDTYKKSKKGLEAHEFFGDYSSILIDSQRIGRAQEIVTFLKTLPEFNGFSKMLDLGGGPGLIGIAIGLEKKDIQGVIFDTPTTAELAKNCIEMYGLDERYKSIGGDFTQDDIGQGYDLILACGVLNFAKHDLDGTMSKLYKSLNSGGILLSISEGIMEEGTKPTKMVLDWLPSRLEGMDFQLKRGQIGESALKNGFIHNKRVSMDTTIGPVDVDILKK